MNAIRTLAVALLGGLMCSEASADQGGFYGLLRSRDLAPFGALRLDMRPAHAVSIEPGTWALETEIGYQNTWALSPGVEKYLTSLEATGRRRIGPAEVAAIEALPGENYLIDLEAGTIDLIAHYKVSQNLAVYGIVSAISYRGGFLDNTIEQFHDTFGFNSVGRPAAARNRTTLIYDLKKTHVVLLDRPTDGGFADPTVGVRYAGLGFSDRWRLTLEAAVKIPVRGSRPLLSTGRTDFGVQAALQRTGVRHGFYLDAAAVYYSGSPEPFPQDAQVIPTLLLGYEYRWTARTNLNVQAYASESVYSHRQTDLGELLATKYQVSIGMRHRLENWLVTFGVTENVQNMNNTPDIGFQLGLAWIPYRR